MKVLVVTVVHRPDDARILYREIAALRAAGHEVTYAAPFTAYGVTPPAGVATRDLPRAVGRSRVTALRAARRLLRTLGPEHDLVLLHDPELLVAAAGLRLPNVVWDVHEDTAAAVSLKPWLPSVVRRPVAAAVHGVESLAARHRYLLLAEDGYRDRFTSQHPVVPNSTSVPTHVPPPGNDRVVYVGHLSLARGAEELALLGALLRGSGITVEVVGHADAEATDLLMAATGAGLVTWHGFVPNDRAVQLVEGALAGLSLLHDEPNYRHSRPTKIIEYMAHGVPVITTPAPPARALVEDADAGVVVPFGPPADVAADVADAVRALAADPARAAELGRRGHEAAARDHSWDVDGPAFVRVLEGWAGART